MKPGKRVSPKSYLSQLGLYMPVLIFFLATLVGCTLMPIKVKDSLPADSRKGYVEFYYLKSEGTIRDVIGGTTFRLQIYSFENNKKVYEGETGSDFGGSKIGFRVAKLPGNYKFAIFCIGTSMEKVIDVTVEEGKVTPVKMQFSNFEKGLGGYNITRVTFNLAVKVEEARPTYELNSVPPPGTGSGPQSASTAATSGGPKEEDIARGLALVSDRQYIKAASSLDSGLKWLKSDSAYRATTDSLVGKEADYIAKLIEQIRRADQKGVFGSSDPVAKVIEKAIEAQAKVIKAIDDRRRSQSGATSAPTAKEKSPRTLPETKMQSTLGTGSGSVRGVEPKPETGTESFRRFLASGRGGEAKPTTGLGSVSGVLKNKETGTPIKNATIALIKVKSVEGGKVTIEFGVSADGKMVGGMSTKTDAAGTFRFEEVAKGAYVLGAVDQAGKNIVVIVKEDDNVKDLGIVYQKKQPDKPKP